MKKAFGILLVLIMLFSLAACNKDQQQPAASSPGTAPAASPAASPPAANPAPSSIPNQPSSAAPSTVPLEPPKGDEKYGGVLRFVCTAEGSTPVGIPWEVFGVDNALTLPSFECLFNEETTGEIHPHLAESFKIDMDKKEIFIKLREGVHFIDGSELTAEVAIWNLLLAQEANYVSRVVTSMEERGKYEFALLFDSFSNEILSSLATRSAGIMSKEAYETHGVEWARENPVGTGPFKFKEYVHGSHLTYVRNENYWQEGKPYLDGMEIQFIRDVMTQNAAIQSEGDQSINLLNTTSGEQVALLRDLGLEASLQPIGAISLTPNSLDADSPLAILEVRQAISYALNRDILMQARGFGVMTPAYQFVDPAWREAQLPAEYNCAYDVEKSKALLAQAGYPNGFNTKLIAQPGLADRDTVVAIQGMLAAVGINAELDFPDSGGYSSVRASGWDGLLVQHTRSLASTSRTFSYYFGPSRILTRLWVPDEMQAAIEAAAAKADNAEELKVCHKMVLDNMLVIPVYNLADGWVTKPYVKGGEFGLWGSGTMGLPFNIYFEN